MTQFKKQLIAAAATGLLMLNIAAPAFATDQSDPSNSGTTLVVSGNGSKSDSNVHVDSSNTNTIAQTNTANVNNDIHSNSSTGGNTAKDNTGGDVTVSTGDAKSKTTVSNVLNSNQASVDCGCNNGDANVTISGNGSDSKNKAKLDLSNDNEIGQYNTANVKNTVDANAKTGNNNANDNTGGTVKVLTGDATVGVDVSTKANANFANVGGNGNGGTNGSIDAVISGNGSDSHNRINLDVANENAILQQNDAYIKNNIDANAKTGDNTAKDNTGGDVYVVTGDAKSTVGVDNMVNFNWADVDCGCVSDIFAKTAGNGTYTKNKINADLGNSLDLTQSNAGGERSLLDNKVNGNAKTGDNNAKDNTGPVLTDPTWVLTGDGNSNVDVNNAGNSNVYGAGMPTDWPTMGSGLSITLNLDDLAKLLNIQL